ncbi:MAG: hypothetical protein WAV45_17070 [Propionibacteriaceae bacterium]|nr:hypothetical protein [Micropruina sp.]
MLVSLLIILLLVILLALTVAPLESLGWWSHTGADQAANFAESVIDAEATAKTEASETPTYSRYLIYLSGIGAIDGTSIPEEERPFLKGIQDGLPTTLVIDDVFPYSVDNNGLTAQRSMARLWRGIEKLRLKNPNSQAAMLVNARNAIQMFVCSDRRYGPTYNIGTAQVITESLKRHGYPFGSGIPVTILGWSGGAQIALGACWYLGMEGMPLSVVSIGGMMSDDYGLDKIDKVWHLAGSKDPMQKLGGILYAGRWPHALFSPWTKAMKEGRIDIIPIGPMTHFMSKHYFDTETFGPDGRSYLQVSIDAVVAVLEGKPVKTVPLTS